MASSEPHGVNAELEPFGARGEAPADAPARIALSHGLKSWPVTDSSGARVATVHGLLLEGWLGPHLSMENAGIRVDRPIGTAEEVELHIVRGVSGCLLVETHGGPFGRRLYPDCGASLPLVYCPETRRFGGSANEILDPAAYEERFLRDRHARLVTAEGRAGWIPGTLTAHRGISRTRRSSPPPPPPLRKRRRPPPRRWRASPAPPPAATASPSG
ncbi:hypothetical protein L6Q21_12290 [Sandaracinobacter sp. RS1-74]|uniref:hypothetical protein n=1 Tax=Sandaracinobacteroides sayramensis TaxID=2913411 RepID=UPI001EDB1CDE|nr:hypothetical protein [Sandaracinobacteroides sayramensis]MCG2841762.1 hypothetical protein [Sandaracinobacteroides sayramensis]